MQKAEDIDDMSHIHDKHMKKLQERALLSDHLKPIHKAIIDMLDLGLQFDAAITKRGIKLAIASTSRKTKPPTRKKTSTSKPIPNDSTSSPDDDDELPSDQGERFGNAPIQHNLTETLRKIDAEFARLLPFITAGLRSVGRVGAEPMWEQFAERLEWEGKKDGV